MSEAFFNGLLTVLAANRSESSHFAGGIVLHVAPDSARFSRDFDIFHEIADEVVRSSVRDVASLRAAGFLVEEQSTFGEWERVVAFRRAIVRRGQEAVEIDWVMDSAFRFFPIERDDDLGWRLHRFDIATNKALALAARRETRDYVDIVEIARTYPLAAIVWAACGKDPGFNPASLLKMMLRFARIDPVELDEIQARRIDPIALKERWIEISDEAAEQITQLADERPEIPVGVAFVDDDGVPQWIGDDPGLHIHPPRIGGCWPTVREVPL